MLLAFCLSALQSAAQPAIPDLFRPDPSLRFLETRGQLLQEEAKRVPLAVEAIDTFELRARAVSPLEAVQNGKGRSRWDREVRSSPEASLDSRPWPYRIRMSRPRDSLSRWTAWLDLDRASKQFPGSFLEVQVIAGPRAYRPTTKDENCDSTWAKAVFLVTDLGIVAHTAGPDWLEIQSLDLARVRPWGNVPLERIFPSPAKAQTDSLGRFRIAKRGDSDSSEIWLAKTPGDPARIALLRLEEDRYEEGPWQQFQQVEFLGGDAGSRTFRDGQRVFPYVFRSSHRPGDTLVVGCLVRGPGGALAKSKTVKLRISRGITDIDSTRVTLDASGHAQWRWTLPARIPSGHYTVLAGIDGSSETTRFSVEEAKIPRLKVELSEDTTHKKAKGTRWVVDALWSSGRRAAGLPLELRVECTGYPFRGSQYSSLPLERGSDASAEWDTTVHASLDSLGRFSTQKLVPPRSISGDGGSCKIVASVFEDGGHPTSDRLSRWYETWRAGPGIKTLPKDTLLKLRAAWFDENDSLVRKVPLRIRIFWDKKELASKNLLSGEAWSLPVRQVSKHLDDPSHGYTLDAVVCAQDGKTCIHKPLALESNGRDELSWDNLYGIDDDRASKDPDTVQHPDLSPRIVREGDSVQVRWEASQSGLAWVQVIQGERTLLRELRAVKTGTNLWKGASDSTWSPGVHVVVMEFARRMDSLPWVQVAGMRVQVDRRPDSLPLRLLTDSVFHPGKIGRVSLLNPTGRQGTFVLSAIDQGILDLDNFRMSDPDGIFARPEEGRFQWWNGCGSRGELYASEQLATCSTEPNPFGSGNGFGGRSGFGSGNGGGRSGMGMGTGEGPAGPARSLAKPLAWISGILPLPASRTDLEIPIPSFLGSARIRVMAASGRDIRLLDTQVVSRSALEVVVTTPQVLAPMDTVMALVKVHGKPLVAGTLRSRSWEGIRARDTATAPLAFDAQGWAYARLPLVAASQPGDGWLEIEARQGSDVQAMTSRVEIRDDLHLASDVVHGATAEGSLNLSLPRRYLDSSLTSRLEVSTRGFLGVDRTIQELLRYPHGCLEQIVSAVFPQLFLEELAPGSTPSQIAQARSHAGEAIARIQRLATSDDLLSLWPGGQKSDPFASLWAARFLREASRKNVEGGTTLLLNLTSGLTQVRLEDPTEDLQRLAILPTLTSRHERSKDLDTTQLDSLDALKLSREARWILAAAWERRGMHDRALAQVTKALSTPAALSRTGRHGRASRLRDQAWALEAMFTLSQRTARDSLLDLLGRDLASGRWLSTQEQGAMLVALAKVLKPQSANQVDTLLWRTPAGKWNRMELIDGRKSVQIPSEMDAVEVFSRGKTRVFQAQVHRHGILRSPETLRDSGLALEVRRIDPTGAVLAGTSRERDAFDLELRVKNTSEQDLTDLAATIALPGGWSVRRDDLPKNRAGVKYQDVRADRIVEHFDLALGKELVLRIPLRAVQEGSYRAPEVVVEALYDPALRAQWKGHRTRVEAR